MIHLRWRARPHEYGQLVKVTCERGSPLGLHTHDYPELFWITEGRCRHRINGTEEVLKTGDLVFIRASDRHQLVSSHDERFSMTNLECKRDLIREMKRRYPKTFAVWFGEKRELPLRIHLGDNRLERLQQFSMEFASRIPDALQVEGFLLDLARLLADSRPSLTGLADCPEWLQSSLLKAQSLAIFSQGPRGLFRAAGRCPEHVARCCRHYLQKTPTELIEQFRMTHAERELRLTQRPVTEIALACGYSTTAQFHRAYKKHYQKTPLRYRKWMHGG